MIVAKWTRSQPWRREPDQGGEQAEYARAHCGRDCGEWLARMWFEHYPIPREYPYAFRLRPGFVLHDTSGLPFRPGFGLHDASGLPYGLWELPKRFQEQRSKALQRGESLRNWQPLPRHRLADEEYQRAVGLAYDRLPGVVGVIEGTKTTVPTYLVDPHKTGGIVVVRCPNCGWQNEVRPYPKPIVGKQDSENRYSRGRQKARKPSTIGKAASKQQAQKAIIVVNAQKPDVIE